MREMRCGARGLLEIELAGRIEKKQYIYISAWAAQPTGSGNNIDRIGAAGEMRHEAIVQAAAYRMEVNKSPHCLSDDS